MYNYILLQNFGHGHNHYVDTVEAASSTVSGTPFYGGGEGFSLASGKSSRAFLGTLDEVRFFDNVLTQEDVDNLFNYNELLLACWNYTAKYKGLQRLYRANGGGLFPKELKVPGSVDISTGVMIDEGIKIDSSDYRIIQ